MRLLTLQCVRQNATRFRMHVRRQRQKLQTASPQPATMYAGRVGGKLQQAVGYTQSFSLPGLIFAGLALDPGRIIIPGGFSGTAPSSQAR